MPLPLSHYFHFVLLPAEQFGHHPHLAALPLPLALEQTDLVNVGVLVLGRHIATMLRMMNLRVRKVSSCTSISDLLVISF